MRINAQIKGCLAIVLCTLFFTNCNHSKTDGVDLYRNKCLSCHGSQGQGLNNLIPPLAGSNWLVEPDLRSQLPCIIRHGMQGKILVNGKEYEGVMQAAPSLNAVDITNLINYISNTWGNTAPPVSLQEVQEAINQCK
jgi:mono/diheme cytochrome c family protein